MKVNINRQAAGLEDLLFGVGTVEQIRQGTVVTVTKINAGNMPFDESQTLAEALVPINEQIIPNLPEILLVDTNAATATAKAAEALASATATATSATNAQVSATAAATSATNAQVSATAAAASYDAFDDRYLGSKATNPTLDNDGGALLTGATYWNTTSLDYRVYNGTAWTAPATLASASATNAATSATTATTQATNAATSATNAATSATSASTSASTATTQAGLANTARAAAEAALDAFDDRYLGSKASAPTLDNDGNALLSGALYFNETLNAMYVYDLSTITWLSLAFVPTDHNGLTNIGTNTHAQVDTALTRLVNTSGTNTGDETTSTIKTKLGVTTLSGSNTGDQDLSGYSLTSHNHTIDGLSNVVVTTNSDNEVLAWDSATSKWINQTAAEAGLSTSGHNHTGVYEPANANIQTHISSTSNPHSTTAAQVGAMSTSHAANAITGLAAVAPIVDGIAAVGTSTSVARQDHVHPSDTSKAPLVSPALTGTPTAPTATAGTNTTQLATTAFVLANSVQTTEYASADGTVGGTVKARINGTTLYLRTDGTNA